MHLMTRKMDAQTNQEKDALTGEKEPGAVYNTNYLGAGAIHQNWYPHRAFHWKIDNRWLRHILQLKL